MSTEKNVTFSEKMDKNRSGYRSKLGEEDEEDDMLSDCSEDEYTSEEEADEEVVDPTQKAQSAPAQPGDLLPPFVPEGTKFAAASSGKVSASLVDGGSNSKVFEVNMHMAGSLKELDAKRVSAAILKSACDEISARFGSQAPIKEIAVIKYENGSPVSLKLNGDHLPGEKHTNTLTDTGVCMMELEANTKLSFAEPKVIYTCEPSEFQQQLAADFPNVDIANVHKQITELPGVSGHVFVPAKSIIMYGIEKQLEKMAKLAKEKGETFSLAAAAAQPVSETGMMSVKKEVAVKAVNLIQAWYKNTKDRIDVDNELHFTLSRSRLSPQAKETQKSSAAPTAWSDTRELSKSLKSGHTIENQLLKPF